MKAAEFRPQTLFFYGAVVSLAIREAITRVVPHAFTPTFEGLPAFWIEALRLLVFLVLTVRFYLGATEFFDKYSAGQRNAEAYVFDFLSGLLHFLMFFALAVAVTAHPTQGVPQTWPPHAFLFTLTAILLWDWVWWSFSKLLGWPLGAPVPEWMAINTLTVVLIVAVYLGSQDLLSVQQTTAESLAMIPVLAFSIVDLMEMSQGEAWIADAVSSILSRSG